MMEPLVFEPYLRPMVWGGRLLGERFGKQLPTAATYGETWELSGHAQHVSRVASGPLAGMPLDELCTRYAREVFGDQIPADGKFPLLIKLLDCHQLLSIQVHPNDDLAAQLLPGERGKTEAWIILSAGPNGRIYAGLKPGVDRALLEQHLAAGTTDQCLHSVQPRPGDCIFLPAGTVHAVGGGVVMAEVQQTSDATFRLFDWNRLGTDGQPRALHLEQSLASIDWNAGPVEPTVGQAIAGLPPGVQGEALVRCPYFELDRIEVGNPAATGSFAVPADGRLTIWLVLAGRGSLHSADSSAGQAFQAGQTVLVPAAAAAVEWRTAAGSAATEPLLLLRIRLPQT